GNIPLNDLQIAVQNASENPQSAKQLVQSLRQQGFTNVFLIEDWSDRLQKTQIIAQSGDLGAANQFHEKLGLGQVEASSTGELGSDLTIRVGNDWQATP
ncbi:MAG: LytR C-terminal domain-containing protein, partial [Synechococcales cyanobacterium]